MPSVIDVIHRLLPRGSGPATPPSWKTVPVWPPDVFAVAATLVNMSGCYARARYAPGPVCCFDKAYREEIERVGSAWSDWTLDSVLQKYWDILVGSAWPEVFDRSSTNEQWWDAALRLMAISDRASVGFGFGGKSTTGVPLGRFIFEAMRDYLLGTPVLLQLPTSLCIRVPAAEACVQPKTRTPQSGCTLRALSHNLALLPPVGEVVTNWLPTGSDPTDLKGQRQLRILVVPFPFEVPGTAFRFGDRHVEDSTAVTNVFDVEQTWLNGLNHVNIANLIANLIKQAETQEGGHVNVVVLPEIALTEAMAQKVAETLASSDAVNALQLFISGATYSDGGAARNVAYVAFMDDENVYTYARQSKHHRWRIDDRQTKQYHLADIRGSSVPAWENVEVADRECFFWVFQLGASVSVLVCEDLARIDPVQTVLRAIGPNLVIALLFDGPQLERRWPGRYATVLADDPGCAVLTVTSVGLVDRTNMPSLKGSRSVALWKDSRTGARELELPNDAKALLLTVDTSLTENWTADLRSDGGMTVDFVFRAAAPIRLPNEQWR